MRSNILLFTLIVLFISCNGNRPKEAQSNDATVIDASALNEIALQPLSEGELQLSDDIFGEIIELSGTPHPVEQVFRISEAEMLVRDSLLIVKNMSNESLFNVFSFPGFRFIKSFGRQGIGPDEFQFPHLVKAEGDEAVCYIYESSHNNLFSLSSTLELNELPYSLPKSERRFGDKQIQSLTDSCFIYVESQKGGKGVFHLQVQNDTVINKEIYNLAFSKSHKNWAAYIGDFGANTQGSRLVFAYKYFKRIVFVDTETGKTRTLVFKTGETKSGSETAMLSPENVTYYWGISAQKDYVYFLYSGRTPIDVSRELDKTSGYIYVEQFDWNGNPVRKYRLDRWGYFCVSEDEKSIILASARDEYQFYSYIIPEY